MIEIKNLSKIYLNGTEKSVVVNKINLNINEGEFLSIVGQSGSGKSKLLHLIGALDTPSDGEILVFGKNISKMKDKDKSKYRRDIIGFVFQDFILEGEKTVLENVMMPLIFAGVNKKRRKEIALDCLEKVHMLDKAKNKANTLSGGQKQKVAIARSLVNQPKILLADEPTGNLDSKNGQEIMKLLRELNQKGYTIVMVTHNNEQSLEADKIVKIMDGTITSIIENKEKPSIEKEVVMEG